MTDQPSAARRSCPVCSGPAGARAFVVAPDGYVRRAPGPLRRYCSPGCRYRARHERTRLQYALLDLETRAAQVRAARIFKIERWRWGTLPHLEAKITDHTAQLRALC